MQFIVKIMYVIVDVETTGGHAEQHRITEIAIYHHDGESITGHYQTLINPEKKIPPFITGLTGIDYEMIKDAPLFKDVAKILFQQLDGKIFVAHNAAFDYSFLKKEFEQVGIRWVPKKLDTIRLSRKIIPGLKSYSLGQLAHHLEIEIKGRHRAGGDAEATAKIFDLLLRNDKTGIIAKQLRRNSGESRLPPNLNETDFINLPHKAGVYYFWDAHGHVIYVGKAVNIKKRIASHFSGVAREWNKTNIRNKIHRITYELTGNEFIALLFETKEIRRLWPPFNIVLKTKNEEWGIFQYEDRLGYIRFCVNEVSKGYKPLTTFGNKGDAWNVLWNVVREFDLCPKLSGLQVAKGPCYSFQTQSCKGACMQIETPRQYNKKVRSAAESLAAKGEETLLLVGAGRKPGEKSLVLVEQGEYVGFGFAEDPLLLNDIQSLRHLIKPEKERRLYQSLIQSYLINPKEQEIVRLKVHEKI